MNHIKIDYCYHTHTIRCGHAEGTDEEYVKKAIKSGIKELGFTDHVPFPDFSQPGIRMDFSQIEEYLSSIRALKSKYEKKIKIYVGFETEYMPQYLSYYRSLKNDYKVDYLILGQHGKLVDGQWMWYNKKPTTTGYIEDSIEALNTGLFSYFAHPDIFINHFLGTEDDFARLATRLLKVAFSRNIPVEINAGGFSPVNTFNKGLAIHYPYLPFFQIASKMENNKVLIGYDAHSPKLLGGPKEVTEACIDIAVKSKVNLINRLEID